MLMVAMMVMFVASMAAASAANFCLGMLKLSWHSAARIQALHTAEAGVEAAMYAFNRQLASGDGWVGWTVGTNGTFTVTKSLYGVSASASLASTFNVQADTNTLTITSRGTLANSRYANADRTVEVVLKAEAKSTPSPFEWGLLSKDKLNIVGNPLCLSYDSSRGAYGAGNSSTNCDVGSMGQRDDAITGGGAAQSYGDAAVAPGGDVDVNHIFWTGKLTRNLDVDFPDVAPPRTNMTRAAINNATTTINIAGSTYIGVPSIGLVNKTLTIAGNGDVVIYVQGTLSVGTAATIRYAPSAGGIISVKMFLNGNVDINGDLNTDGIPANLQMFGTTTCQTLDCQANNSKSMVIYAPQAQIDLSGNATIQGAIIGNVIRVNGNFDFRYDEALANLEIPTNQQKPLKYFVKNWMERY
ncbi:MAG TPA: hypothetical protein DCS43_12790 [Verrucomicrobia bacterium]|nr:hypothetical protein [Verrucomicrobiota bacterium]